jgi:hypothetical protein
MISDSLRYALLSETLESALPERRRAAAALLELARADDEFGSLSDLIATAEQRLGDRPAMRDLVAEFGLN